MATVQPLLMGIVRFLHNLFTVAWFGGMFTLMLTVMPAIKKSELVKEKKKLLFEIQKRLNPIAIVSIIGLVVTGILLGRSSKEFAGLFQFGTPYMTALSIKHVLVILMVIISFLRWRVVKGTCFVKLPPEKFAAALLVINVLLGVIVLFLSSRI